MRSTRFSIALRPPLRNCRTVLNVLCRSSHLRSKRIAGTMRCVSTHRPCSKAVFVVLVIGVAATQGCSEGSTTTGFCRATELVMDVADPVDVGSQFQVSIVLTNLGTEQCLIRQQPSVRLANDTPGAARPRLWVRGVGDDDGQEAGAEAQTTVISPGASVSALMTYLPRCGACDPDGAWTPTRLVLVLPQGGEVDTAWSGESVDDGQEGATHPGTYVGAFVFTG